MTITGEIVDAANGEPLPGASVLVVNNKGYYLGQGVAADGTGKFSFSSPLIDQNFIAITFSGYHALLYEPKLLNNYATVEMYDIENDLEAVEVVGKKNTKAAGVALLVLTSTALIGSMAGKDHSLTKAKGAKMKGAAMGEIKITDAILPVGVLVLGYAVVKPLLQKLGIWDSEEDKKAKQEEKEREEKEETSQKEICEQVATTKTDAEWKQISDKLENAFDYAGYLQSYRDEAVYQLARAKNDCDVQKLISFFGTRQLRNLLLIKDVYYKLNQAVLERLGKSDVATVNDNYMRKGITYRW